MKILIVTSNKNKVKEFKEMLEPLGYEVISLLDQDPIPQIPETGKTFAENATQKAEYGRDHFHCWTVADDSGLCIEALDNQPGINSARYLGHDTSYDYKNKVILERLKEVTNRKAAFHCAIALAIPGQPTKVFEGIFEGEIAKEKAGDNGFGYDPIFYVPSLNKTSAQLSSDQKNEISHRGKATRMLLAYLKDHPV